MKYSELLKSCINELDKIPDIIQEEFGYLSEKQLNWKPNQKSWSILQCLEHLIISDTLYDETFQNILKKYPKNSENKEVKFSWLGKWLLNAVNPSNSNKIPAPKKFQVNIQVNYNKEETINRYLGRVQKLKNYFQQFEGLDLNQIYLSSPALWILRYNLSACIQIMTYHHQRHIIQGVKVKRNTQFPLK